MIEDTSSTGREVRRRRIVERGSDRLALITGRIQTLAPSPPPPPSPSSSTSSSLKSSHAHHSSLPPLPTNFSNRSHVRHKTEGDASVTSMEHNSSSKLSRGNAFNYRNKAEPQLPKSETNMNPVPACKQINEEQSLLVSPKVSKPSSTDEEVFGRQFNLFTAKEINSCIVSTESTRVLCSVIIAILVVLSNLNLPLTIVKSTSTIASRPLYILLLTDVTIVVLKLMHKRRDKEKAEEDKKIDPMNDGLNWVGAFQILETGLVFYQTVRALFIDISCYTVVVICGLCLV